MLKGVESYKYLSELWAFRVLYAKSSSRDDCKMHILRSDAFCMQKMQRVLAVMIVRCIFCGQMHFCCARLVLLPDWADSLLCQNARFTDARLEILCFSTKLPDCNCQTGARLMQAGQIKVNKNRKGHTVHNATK